MKRAAFTLAILAAFGMAGQAAAGGNGWGKGGKHDAEVVTAGSSIDGPFGDVRLGGAVTFTTVADGLTSDEHPMVGVRCWQEGVLVYAELGVPETVFTLGGGMSDWWLTPGPATCRAELDAYGDGTIRILAETADWSADGSG